MLFPAIWTEHNVATGFNGARSVYPSDVDGDGDVDVLGAASLAWAISWWENLNGTGTNWVEHSISNNFNYAFSVHAYDLDGDGDTDVLGAAYNGDAITWWENTVGSGMIWNEHIIDGGFDGAMDVTVADMDGDGDVDVVGAANDDADISWWDVTSFTESGELVSSIFDTGSNPIWDSLWWSSEEPPGAYIYFRVRCSTDPADMGLWSDDITVPGSLEGLLNDGDRYVQYNVRFESVNPEVSPVLEEVTLSWNGFVGIDDENQSINLSDFQLLQNYPNPFNGSTQIDYILPGALQLRIDVYDMYGRNVANLVDGEKPAGLHTIRWDARDHSSGIYYYRIKTEEYETTKRMILN